MPEREREREEGYNPISQVQIYDSNVLSPTQSNPTEHFLPSSNSFGHTQSKPI